jgi:SAM-dependent methyltransferase
MVCDFYDPAKHTEVSIRRARQAYPPYPGTLSANTAQLPFADGFFDISCVIFAAHEIRDDAERASFFQELKRVTKAGEQIYVTEHLRDLPNFLVYTIGFFHFLPQKAWFRTFEAAGLTLVKMEKATPFVTTFVLENHETCCGGGLWRWESPPPQQVYGTTP